MTENLHVFNDAGEPEVIAWFDDFDGNHPYRALSNFYIGEPIFMGPSGVFATGEHAYAALKADRDQDYRAIQRARTPQKAKTLGRKCKLRPDWEEVKYDAMMAVLRHKFTLGRPEGHILMSTRDALLIEGTLWQDQVWGVELTTVEQDPLTAAGRNWLGTMLMARRAELKAEMRFGHTYRAGSFNARFLIENN